MTRPLPCLPGPRWRRAVAAALLVLMPTPGATEAETTPWNTLAAPAAFAVADPLAALGEEERQALARYARLAPRLAEPHLAPPVRARLAAHRDAAEARLAARGLDADGILAEQRAFAEATRSTATAVNPALDGATVTLSGFLVPAPDDPDGMAVAYLVPQFGMCSHVPPPMPNQLVRLRLPPEVLAGGLHYAAIVTGTLRAAETDQSVFVVDGPVRMWSSWTMDVHSTGTWEPFGAL